MASLEMFQRDFGAARGLATMKLGVARDISLPVSSEPSVSDAESLYSGDFSDVSVQTAESQTSSTLDVSREKTALVLVNGLKPVTLSGRCSPNRLCYSGETDELNGARQQSSREMTSGESRLKVADNVGSYMVPQLDQVDEWLSKSSFSCADSDIIDDTSSPSSNEVACEEDGISPELCYEVLQTMIPDSLSTVENLDDMLISVRQCMLDLQMLVQENHIPFNTVGADPGGNQPQGSGIGASSNANRGGQSGLPNSRKRRSHKRQTSDESHDDGDGDGDEDEDGAGRVGPRRAKLLPQNTRLSCPFRKRNTLRFNIRDHSTCATTHYSDLSSIK